MSVLPTIFQRTVAEYEVFKRKFAEFTAVCEQVLNNNEYLPGASCVSEDGLTTLRAFGRRYEISFDLTDGSFGSIGVLRISDTRKADSVPFEPLLRRYFDRSGNVKTDPENATFGYHSMNEKGFVAEVLNELASIYLKRPK